MSSLTALRDHQADAGASMSGAVADVAEFLQPVAADANAGLAALELSDSDRLVWAESVTMRIREGLVGSAVALCTLRDRLDSLYQAIAEAIAGKAYEAKGFDTFRDYWQANFDDLGKVLTRDERNQAIAYLSSAGMSQSIIGIVAGLTQQRVSRMLANQKKNLVPHTTLLYVGQDSDSSPAGPTSAGRTASQDGETGEDPAAPVTTANDRRYAPPRTRTGQILDWIWLTSLTSPRDGKPSTWNLRRIETEYGVPRSTASRILSAGRPTDRELALLWAHAKRMQDQGLGPARIGSDLGGLRTDGVKWLLTMMDSDRQTGIKPYMPVRAWERVLLDPQRVREWASRYGARLVLVDGTETTQVELARWLGVGQPKISEDLNLWADELTAASDLSERAAEQGIEIKRPEEQRTMEDADREDADLTRLGYERCGDSSMGRTLDPGPRQWASNAADSSESYGPPNSPQARAWYAAFMPCAADQLDLLMGPVNLGLSMPDALPADVIDRIAPVVSRLAEASARWKRDIEQSRKRRIADERIQRREQRIAAKVERYAEEAGR